MTTAELETALRDSVTLDGCRTPADLQYAIRNIEARHAVEGITEADEAAWEDVKRQHIERVFRVVTA